MTTASIVPRIGVINGATIMAPITVAVESAATPADAMIDAKTRRDPESAEAPTHVDAFEEHLLAHVFQGVPRRVEGWVERVDRD